MKQPKKDKQKKKSAITPTPWKNEEPTGKGFGRSDLIAGKANKKIKAFQKRDREIQKKIDSKRQRHKPMDISQSEWEEKWERIFRPKEDKEDIEVKKE